MDGTGYTSASLQERDETLNFTDSGGPELDLIKASLADVVEALQGGRVTSEWLVTRADELDAIENDNLQGECYKAVFEALDRELALKIARSLDEERHQGYCRGPLHGVPIIVKDHLGTAAELGMSTTAGMQPLVGSRCKHDAPIIRRLREQGAISKASMTILHNVYSIPPVAASWNPILGRARGVFVPSITNGSSSGSAIALATGMCAASIGGEICGSIVDPCRAAGLYGFKPTLGLIRDSNGGSVAISDRYDVTGPMGKGVMDLAMVLDGMIEEAELGGGTFVDAVISDKPGVTYGDLSKGVEGRGKAGKLRVGIIHPVPYPGDAPEVFDRIRTEFLTAINVLRTIPDLELVFERSSDIIESDGIPAVDAFCTTPTDDTFTFPPSLWAVRHERDYAPYRKAAHTLRAVDMYHLVTGFLSGLTFPKGHKVNDTPKRLADALKGMPNPYLAESGSDGNMAHIDRMLELKGDATVEGYAKATELFARLKGDICAFMDRERLDAVVGPLRLCVFSTAAGTPLGTVPTGMSTSGLPSHVLIMGPPRADRAVLRVMSMCEAALPGRPMPPFWHAAWTAKPEHPC